MTSVGYLRSEIAKLDDLLHEREPLPNYPGSQVSRRSLELHKARLEQQLKVLERSELEIHLEGLPVKGHEIRIDALARFLARLQDSVSSIAQALTGRVTERAPLPAALRESVGLRLAAVFPGSFGATLVGPDRPSEEGLFESSRGPSVLDLALDRAFDLIDTANSDEGASEEAIVELVAPLGARTLGHLRRLSQHLGDEELSAEFVWTASSSQTPRLHQLTVRGARRLNDILTHNSATEEVVTLTGLLGTASQIRNMVELQLGNNDIVSARVIDDVVPDLRRYFGGTVRATFDVTLFVSLTTGAERRTYVLTSLEPAANEDHR